jgi:hypothetical protein
MPIAKIRLPDGRIGRFKVPEGTTPEQVLDYANQNSNLFKAQEPVEAQQPQQIEQPTQQPVEQIAEPTQQVPSDNMAMIPTDETPEQSQLGIKNAKRRKEQASSIFGAGGLIDRGGKALQELPVIGGALTAGEDLLLSGLQVGANLLMPNTLGKPMNEYMQKREADLEKRLPTGNQRARLATNILAPSGVGLVKGAVIGSALSPYTGGGETGDFLQDKAISTALGVGGGAVAKGAGSLVSKVPEATVALAKRAKDLGIKLRVDQIKPTRFRKTVQKISQDVPFSGVDAQEATQRTQWNTAVAKTLGNQITDLTPESINKFAKLNSAKYDKALKDTKINVFQDDVTQLQSQIDFIKNSVSPLQFKKINSVFKTVIDDFSEGLDGADFKAVSATKINGLRRDLLNIASKSTGDSKNVINETADFVHDVLNKSLPDDKSKLLQQANNEYRNYKTIQPLLEKSTTGEINPTELLNRVASSKYITASKANIGKDPLVDLARIGKEFLPKAGGSDTFAKSATAGLTGASILSPKTLLTLTGGAALNRLGQSINKSPSNVAKHLAGGGLINKGLTALSKNADQIATQSSRATSSILNSLRNPQQETIQEKPIETSRDDAFNVVRQRLRNNNRRDQDFQSLRQRLRQRPQANAGGISGIDLDRFIKDTVQAESSGDPNAKSKTSTASGLAGFTNDTWELVKNKFGKQYNLTNKNDPEQQKIATNLLAQDNYNILKNKLKNHNITNKDLYVAHFMGANGATRMILNVKRGQGDKPAYETFRKEANANKTIFFDGKRPRTIKEVYNVLSSKVS